MLPEIASRAAPCIDALMPLTNAKAARIEDRCNYVVTGYVLTHRDLAKKAIVDMAAVRWFPNVDEFMHMLAGRKVTPGPGLPPPDWIAEEVIAQPALVAVTAATPTAPLRPILTAPPSAKLHESTESALAALAKELGCVFNEAVPHNAGWFVPGRPTACASAYDAIRGLVASLKSRGTVYEGKAGTTVIDDGPLASEALVRQTDADQEQKRKDLLPAVEQGALF